MKNRMNKGFTLIELLIVIAIIGILAAVLIPQLLGARVAANKRSLQSHAATVYKAGLAIIGENTSLKAGDVTAALQAACGSATPTTKITVSGVDYLYGWNAAPGGIKGLACAVTATTGGVATDNDFTVTVTGDPGDGVATWNSVNGRNPTK